MSPPSPTRPTTRPSSTRSAGSASVSPELRARLAAEAFSTVAAYHAEIAAYLNQIAGQHVPEPAGASSSRRSTTCATARTRTSGPRSTARRPTGARRSPTRRQLQGGRPSFNNLLDLDAAYRIARDYTAPTVAIVKHTDPVGLASHDELVEAYRHALETDPVASFGGHRRRQPRARRGDRPGDRRELVRGRRRARASARPRSASCTAKAGLELLAVPPDPTDGMRDYGIANLDFKRVAGGLLVEDLDDLGLDRGQLQVVTKRRPTLEELTDLLFAWRAVRHVRSNAIVLARNGATVGIGAGQASRQVSVEIALRRAGDRAKTAVMASDAYFPFPDGIQAAAHRPA